MRGPLIGPFRVLRLYGVVCTYEALSMQYVADEDDDDHLLSGIHSPSARAQCSAVQCIKE